MLNAKLPGPEEDHDAVVYDLETSETNTFHGQIFQFSGLHLDAKLEITGDFDARARRLPYVVPHPDAVRITGYDLHERRRALLDDYDLAARIEHELAPVQNRTRVFITYNGISFDDPMIRSTQFRNLRDPYIMSGKNTVRMDLLHLCRLVYAMTGPKHFHLGTDPIGGKPSYKLEHLARANGIRFHAHDATGDVQATRTVGLWLKERHPIAWNKAFTCGSAERVDRFLSQACDSEEPCWQYVHFGRPELVPFLVLGNKDKRWLVADLRHSPDDVDPTLGIGDLTLGRSAPLRVVKSNAAPYVFPREDGSLFAVRRDFDEARINALKWSCECGLREDVLGAFRKDVPLPRPGATSEERMFEAFPGWPDRNRRKAFHAARDWDGRAAVAFEDARLADFAARLVLRHAEGIDDHEAARLGALCSDALNRPFAPSNDRWTTLEQAMPAADPEWLSWAAQTFPETACAPAP